RNQAKVLPVKLVPRRPGENSNHPDSSENESQRKTRGQLAYENSPPVAQPHLLKSHRANHKRRRLRSRVSARGNDQWNEEREHNGALDLLFVKLHRRRGQHFAQEKERQPTRALLDHLKEIDLQIRLIQGFGTPEFMN